MKAKKNEEGWDNFRYVSSRYYSECGSASLTSLNFTRGWFDGGISGKEPCWHFPLSLNDGSTHRVYCRKPGARPGIYNGQPCWVIRSTAHSHTTKEK